MTPAFSCHLLSLGSISAHLHHATSKFLSEKMSAKILFYMAQRFFGVRKMVLFYNSLKYPMDLGR